MKKHFLIGGLLCLAILIGLFFFVDGNEQKLYVNQLSPRDKYIPKVKYQLFSPGLEYERIIETIYILKDDELPKTGELEGHKITVQEVNIDNSSVTGEKVFRAYLKIMFNGKEEKIGFWHPNPEVYDKTNGCLNQNNRNVCGGVLGVVTEEWREDGALYQKEVILQEIDYDIVSDKWNYVKIALLLYKEDIDLPQLH